MMKRLMCMLLTLCIIWSALTTTALATTTGDSNYYDKDVTWLGTTAEYQKTLKGFFDSGLRKVAVDGKNGLVDMSGSWVVQPIYDQIEAHYWNWKSYGSRALYPKQGGEYERTETIFVDGYVQAIRDGKMGLLDTTGKEVIPCNYDGVGLPFEGVSRITKVVNGKTYLGYWNLALGREIVAPNKYFLPENYEYLGSPQGDIPNQFIMANEKEGKNPVFFDFIQGYAMVPTGKVVKVFQERDYKDMGISAELFYVQIIDKNGKEALPQAYPFNMSPSIIRPYPQGGPYLVYDELSTKRLRMIADGGGYDVIFLSHLESGIVGDKGILVPAQYHGGIWGNAATGWYPPGAQIQLIPELSLAITLNCGYDGFRESAAQKGVINFSNKGILPFGTLHFLSYDSQHKVFYGGVNEAIYRPDGTKIVGTEGRLNISVENGYVVLSETDEHGNLLSIRGVTSVKTCKSYTHENLKGSGATLVSAKDTLWVQKGNQWGLVNLEGTVLLPFEYDEIDDGAWLDPTTPYAIVKKDGKWGMVDTAGKVLLPCNYSSIQWGDEGYLNIQEDATGKYGIYHLGTMKITTPCILPGPISDGRYSQLLAGSIGGTVAIQIDRGLKALFDMDRGKQVTPTYDGISPFGRGLFINTHQDQFGPDGRIVFSRVEDETTHTLVVKDGKVGSINAARLKLGGNLPTASYVKPVANPINARSFVISYPEKRTYMVGDGFNITGLVIHYQDEQGVRSVMDNTKFKFFTSGTVELTQGRPFTTSGTKTVEIRYNDKKIDTFDIKVVAESAGNILQSGDYYMQIFGKYIYPVKASGIYWLELSDKKPEKPFTVKLTNHDEKRGPMYTIAYDGSYIIQPTSKNGAQLQSSNVPTTWRINQYASFCTIRDYGNQKLLVNASGEKKDNGTKIIVWTSSGSAPDHGKILFIPAN